MANSAEKLGRKLGQSELMYEFMTNRFDICIYFQAAVLKSNYFFTVEEFTESLKVLINFQPFLRTKVVREKGLVEGKEKESYFFRPCDVDVSTLLRVRRKTSEEDWTEIIKEEEYYLSKDEKFGAGPQWRVVLSFKEEENGDSGQNNHDGQFYHYDVVFLMQHMLVDAVSSYDMVYRQFLPILNNIINKKPPADKFLNPLELAPSYEEEFLQLKDSSDIKTPWYIKTMMSLLRAINRTFSKNLYEPLFKSEGSPYSDQGLGPCIKVIGEELLGKMLKMRKERDVGIHSMLLTAFSFAMLKLLQRCGTPLPNVIKSGWPTDSRKLCQKFKSPQPLGILVGVPAMSELTVPKPFQIDKETFWDKAKVIEVKAKGQGRAPKNLIGLKAQHYIIDNLKILESYEELYSEIGFKPHFMLSNLSKCSPGPKLQETSPHFVDAQEMYFGICGKGSGGMSFPFFVTATNHKEKIFLANCYRKKWINKDFASEFMEEIENMLVMACEEVDDDFEHIESFEG